MKISSDVCQKLARVKEAAMGTWAVEMGRNPAVDKWQAFIKSIPRDTPYENLPEEIRQEIEHWLQKL